MKAQITRAEAIRLFNEAELKWSKSQYYFSKKIKNLLGLPESAIIILEDGEISSLKEKPFPLIDDIVMDNNGLKGKITYNNNYRVIIMWDDHKWYKSHVSCVNEVNLILDESRDFWRVQDEN